MNSIMEKKSIYSSHNVIHVHIFLSCAKSDLPSVMYNAIMNLLVLGKKQRENGEFVYVGTFL